MAEDQTIAAVPPLKQPTQLSDDALSYWQCVLAGVEQAQAELAEIQQLEQRSARLRQSATARIGAYESYAQHLFELLELDARTARIEPDGRITRDGLSVNGAV